MGMLERIHLRRFATLFVLTLSVVVYGQGPGQYEKNGIIKGRVKIESGEPVEYATVSLYSMRDSSLVSGAIAAADGTFQIAELGFGKYYAEVSFVGFDKTVVSNIMLRPPNIQVDIGDVTIAPTTKMIDEVEIVSDKPQVEYRIDKKVVSVSADITAAGGTAIDVLENVPSIETDIEGNISVRGSSNFTVYIDGRPSILQGSDALQQIPASAIESIEIITNPSAKYEAEGTGGIINVIMKKRRGQGLNGIINTSIGTNNKYSADMLLNYRANSFNLYGGLNYNKRNYEMEARSHEQSWRTYYDSINDVSYVDTTDERVLSKINNERNGLGFKLGFDYFINDNNTVSLSGAYDRRTGNRYSDSYESETRLGVLSNYYTHNFGERTSDNYEVNADYKSKFNDKGHELTASFNMEGETGGHDQGLVRYYDSPDGAIQTSYNDGDDNPEWELRFKADYVNPYSEHGKFETGIQFDADQAHYDYYFQELDQDAGWQDVDSLTQVLDINRAVYSAYALYSNRIFWGIDVQAGLRLEYTDRIVKADKDYPIQRPDLFPSIHMSKQFNDHNQLMGGYTRRIDRPREWNLNPVRRYWDAERIRVGNPALEPEYTDMMEINYQYSFNRSFVSFEVYHRHNTNLIERTQQLLPGNEDITLHTSVNVGQRNSTGMELMSNVVVKKLLVLNGSVSVFHDKLDIDSTVREVDTDDEQFSWRSRFNVTVNAPWKGRLQVGGFYTASSITAQGERGGFFVMNMGYRQDFFDRRLSATLQARDILKSMNFSHVSYFSNRTIEGHFEREAPVITLTLSYKINNYKSRDRNGSGGDDNGNFNGGGDDMF